MQQCRFFLEYLNKLEEKERFDYKTIEIKIIELNKGEWENSSCNCKHWHKNLKFNHFITLACRLKLASYLRIAYSVPMTAKRLVGRPKDSGSCLEREANALRVRAGVDMDYPSDDEEDDVSFSMLAVVTGPPQAPQLCEPPCEEPPVKRKVRRPKRAATDSVPAESQVESNQIIRQSKRLSK